MQGHHLISVEIPRDVAKHLLKHLEAASRLPIRFDWDDANEWLGSLRAALEADDA